jgi:hypothetical protein
MENGEQTGSGGRYDWPVRLGAGVGASVGAALSLLGKSLGVDLGGFWPGLIAFGALVGVGIVLGQLAGSFLSRRLRDR